MENSLLRFPAPTRPTLSDNELHVWRASLDVLPVVREILQSSLNIEEKKRAERFLVTHACERFVVARGILRDLLGSYLEVGAENVLLDYGPEGKPSLSSKHNSKICFNVSHSHGMGLFGFTKGRHVGVDIEYIKKEFRGMEIASHFFSEEEVAALAKLPPEQTDEAFFGCWTRKEAYVKANGQGLRVPLRSFTVKFTESKQLLRDETGTQWSCYALEAGPEFAGAVVAQGEKWDVKFWEWSAGVKKVRASALVDGT